MVECQTETDTGTDTAKHHHTFFCTHIITRFAFGSPYPHSKAEAESSKGSPRFTLRVEHDKDSLSSSSPSKYTHEGSLPTTHTDARTSRRPKQAHTYVIVVLLLLLFLCAGLLSLHGGFTSCRRGCLSHKTPIDEVSDVRPFLGLSREVEVDGVERVLFKTYNLMDEVGWGEYILFVKGQQTFI